MELQKGNVDDILNRMDTVWYVVWDSREHMYNLFNGFLKWEDVWNKIFVNFKQLAGEDIAYQVIVYDSDTLSGNGMCVHPEWRWKGFWTQLIDIQIDLATTLRANSIAIPVLESDSAWRNFIEKLIKKWYKFKEEYQGTFMLYKENF